MSLLLALVCAAAIVAWARGRIRELEWRMEQLQRRVLELEAFATAATASRQAPAAPPVAPPPPLAHPERAWTPLRPPEPVPAPPPPHLAGAVPQAPSVPPLPPPPPPERTLDLESLIGSNWLSKLGVLILLIGIALFLGFSLNEMGPLGRVLTGAAVSLALLGAGVAAERKPDYRILGQALLGGGWAGLYFTAFAAHGLEAARVIENPGTGLMLLLATACGMILHSLRYRNQTITGLAYFAAFLAIAISSLTRFSAVASVPLLASLLALSLKFRWEGLPAAGVLFAYGAYGFDLATGDKDRYLISIGEPVLWIYWFLIEASDLVAKRRGASWPLAPLNLTGFLFATAALWPRGGDAAWPMGPLLGSMAVAQLFSALLRGKWSETRKLEDDSVFGGFRASITYSTLFTVALVLDRFHGLERGFTLALTAQSVALLGWMAGSGYLRGLGAAVFACAAISGDQRPLQWTLAALYLLNRLFLQGGVWYSAGAVVTLGWLGIDFVPARFRPALLTIAAGATGLALRWRGMWEARWAGLLLAFFSVLTAYAPREQIWLTLGLPAVLYAGFGWAIPEGLARGLTFAHFQVFAAVLLFRAMDPSPWLPAAWMAVSLAGWLAAERIRAQSLGWTTLLPVLCALGYWVDHLHGRAAEPWPQAALIALSAVIYLVPPGVMPRLASSVHGALATLLLTAFVEDFVSGPRLTLAWGAEAFFLLGAGIALQRRQLRLSGLALFALCLLKLFFHDFSSLDTVHRILSFIVLGLLLIATSWIYSRFREQIRRYL